MRISGGMWKHRWFMLAVAALLVNGYGVWRINRARTTAQPSSVTTPSATPELKQLCLIGFEPVNQSFESGVIRVKLSTPVNPESAATFVEVSPKVAFHAEPWANWSSEAGFQLVGDFLPGVSYQVTLREGLRAINGTTLATDIVRMISFPDSPASVAIRAAGTYLSSQGNLLLPVSSVNVRRLTVVVERVYPNNLVYFATRNSSEHDAVDNLSHVVGERNYTLAGSLNQTVETMIDLHEFLGETPTGAFYVTVTTDKDQTAGRLVVVTDVGIAAKISEHDLTVWANSIRTLSAITGATVRIFAKTNQEILHGTTDSNGLVRLEVNLGEKSPQPFLVTVSQGTELSYLRLDNTQVSDRGSSGSRPYLNQGYEAFLFTDRGIYRPGETTHLQAVVRGPNVSCPTSFPVQVHVMRPDGRRDRLLTAMLDEFGAAEFAIPWLDYAGTGNYRFQLQLPGQETVIGETSVAVEEFVPPQIAVTVTTPASRLPAGTNFPVEVSGRHLFGRPAAGNAASVGVEFVPEAFAPTGWPDFVFGDPEKKFTSVRVQLGSVPLDENGRATFMAKPATTWRPAAALKAVIVGTVMETGGRTVAAYAGRSIDVYPFYLGIKLDRSGETLMMGQTQAVTVAVIAPDGQAVTPPGSLQWTVSKITWSTILRGDYNGRYSYQSRREVTVILTNQLRVMDGLAKTEWMPSNSGQYLISVRDPASEVSSSISLYVGAPDQEWLAWSMEMPDHVELKLDKDRYAVGDEATLVIQAPFAGKALLTIESDRVLDQQVVVLEKNTAQIKVPVRAGFSPNVYCSINLIRPVQAGEKWSGHRAVGSVPLVIDPAPHRLAVKISAPSQMRPKEKLRVSIDAGEPAEIVLSAVDEGVCQLTGFHRPEPLDYFWAQRWLGVQWNDLYGFLMPEVDDAIRATPSDPGGDGDATMLKRRLNPIQSRRFKPVALWATTLTDANGHAELQLDVPEFTGQLRLTSVALSREKFGSAQTSVLVKRPLVVRSSLPRFLAPDDKCQMPVAVFTDNGSSSNAVVTVTGRGIAVRAPRLPGGDWEITAASTAGVATVTLDVVWEEEHYTEDFELSVRPAAARTTICGSGVIDPGAGVAITPPVNWLPGTAEAQLHCAGLPAMKLSGGLDYLLHYPHGCLEQTTSSAFPLLYLADLAEQLRPGSLGREETAHLVSAGVQRILSMQLPNGGFSLWPNERLTYDWGTVYTTHFLAEAAKAGYPVPKDRLAAACDYLRGQLAKSAGTRDELNLRAYICVALAVAGKPENGWNLRLAEQRERLDSGAQVNVAAAFAAAGRRREALDFLNGVKLSTNETAGREIGGCLNSSVRNQALLLSTWLDLEPGNPIVPVLAQRLEALAGGRSYWYTTQENALALVALGKYARRVAGEKKPFQARVVPQDGRPPLVFDQDRPLILSNAGPVSVTNAGPGMVYYYWRHVGVPANGQASEEDRGLSIRRRLLTQDGAPLAVAEIKQGELVVVEITMTAGAAEVDNVAVDDLLPAGLEIENANLATSQTLPWLKDKQTLPVRYMSIRDDRLVIYTGAFSGTRRVYYAARAVSIGDYVYPAVSAECMYDSELRSIHGKGRLRIQ